MRVSLSVAVLAALAASLASAAIRADVDGRPLTSLERHTAAWAASAGLTGPVMAASPACADTSDCTAELQALLDNESVPVISLAAAGSPYITRELFLRRSNVAIMGDTAAPALLLAKRWCFNSTGASLLTVRGAANVMIAGVTLRMWRSDYANPKWYKHAEWRMALNLQGVVDMLIVGSTFEYSGGDGIYVTGDGGLRNATVNLTLTDVRSRNNYRQGMSLISVDGLQAEGCVFEGTKGTPPMAGVDLEPDFWWQPLRRITFTNCDFSNNTGAGIVLSPHAHNEQSQPYDLTVQACNFHGNHFGVFITSPEHPSAGSSVQLYALNISHSFAEGLYCANYPSIAQMMMISSSNVTGAAAGDSRRPPLYFGASCNNTDVWDVRVNATAPPTDRPFAVFDGLTRHGAPTLSERYFGGRFIVGGPNKSACATNPAHPGRTINVTCDAGL